MNVNRATRLMLVGVLAFSFTACGDNSELDEARDQVTALESEKASLEASLDEQAAALAEAEAAMAEQGQSLILQADIVGEGCMLQNAYVNDGEAKATFRVRVFDPLTGEQLDDQALESVTVTLGDGQVLELRYSAHPPDTTDDFFWAIGWEIFAGYPAGNVSYDIVATGKDGRTGTFEPFNVAPSLLTVMDA
jgi:hypothetical protein